MKKTIITIDGDSFIIPDDQAKDLSGLLEKIGNWTRVERGSYGSGKWEFKPGIGPELSIAITTEDMMKDITPAPEKEKVA